MAAEGHCKGGRSRGPCSHTGQAHVRGAAPLSVALFCVSAVVVSVSCCRVCRLVSWCRGAYCCFQGTRLSLGLLPGCLPCCWQHRPALHALRPRLQALKDGPFTVQLLDVVPHLKSQRLPGSSGSSSRHLQAAPAWGELAVEGAELSEEDSWGRGVSQGRAVLEAQGAADQGLLEQGGGHAHFPGGRKLTLLWGHKKLRQRRALQHSSSELDEGLVEKVKALAASHAIEATDGVDPKRPVSLIVEAVPNMAFEVCVRLATTHACVSCSFWARGALRTWVLCACPRKS